MARTAPARSWPRPQARSPQAPWARRRDPAGLASRGTQRCRAASARLGCALAERRPRTRLGMTLWVAVVTERLGHPPETALSLAGVVGGARRHSRRPAGSASLRTATAVGTQRPRGP